MSNTKIGAFTEIKGIAVKGKMTAAYEEILSREALQFLARLQERFNDERLKLLERRERQQVAIDQGRMPDFLVKTKQIREEDWLVAPLPPDLLDRRVEITGPVDRKMIINALNSGAKVFMADFEDSNSPTWANCVEGQINLRDAVNRTINFNNPFNGKFYRLNDKIATLMVRPRGWHMEEKHVEINGRPMSASLFDFGLYFFHNARNLLNKGSGPYFYLPKLENHLEARLWNDVFLFAQHCLHIPPKSIKATVLIETILAAFEMDEILYELREHSAGLNCGRWDYIFSFIKKFHKSTDAILPNRSQVTMAAPFMRAYSQLLIQTCHRRGVHAMGGMAAQIPIKNDEEANLAALEKVKADKYREVEEGHDGTWVAHPGLVPVALRIFDQLMPGKNQISNKRKDVEVCAKDLLEVPKGSITEAGLRENINVAILYIESWLNGQGCAALYHKMEDAATAEISRSQIWQWVHGEVKLEDGRLVDWFLVEQMMKEEMEKIKAYVGEERYRKGRFEAAIALFIRLIKTEDFTSFLTDEAYSYLV